MNRSDLDALAGKLCALDSRELVYVLARSLPEFEPYQGEPGVEASGLFLGAYSQENGEIAIEIVAYPDPGECGDQLGPNYGFAQRTSSEFRGVDYVSNFKHCLSPVSGVKVHLT